MGETVIAAPPIQVWCLLRDQFEQVTPVQAHLGPRADFVFDTAWDPVSMLHAAPDVVVGVNEHHYEVTECLLAARQATIPTLTVQDGILEWRCQYENPLFGAGGGSPQHQPVMSDKIACIGRQSARQLERWGNAGQCEVIGMPRLDHLLECPMPDRPKAGRRRLLVMTAKKAGFTPSQLAITLQSLAEVRRRLEKRPDVELWWRVSETCARRLGVPNRLYRPAGTGAEPISRSPSLLPLTAVLSEVDAVITTPSTAILESMLMGRPVAVLDYHNVPRFVPTAWTIAAEAHIAPVVEELLAPSARKIAFQEDCLHDVLACDGPAAPRLGRLLELMAAAGRSCRAAGTRLSLPPRLLPEEGGSSIRPPDLSALYPEASVFREEDLLQLQVRLARAEGEIVRLRQRLRRQSLAGRVFAAVRRGWR
jgi:hypothetical protein